MKDAWKKHSSEQEPRHQANEYGLAGFPMVPRMELGLIARNTSRRVGSALVGLSSRLEARAGDAMQHFTDWRTEHRQIPSVAFMRLLEQNDAIYISRAPRDVVQAPDILPLQQQVVLPPIAVE